MADEQKKLTDSGGMPENYVLRSVYGISSIRWHAGNLCMLVVHLVNEDMSARLLPELRFVIQRIFSFTRQKN